MALEAAVANGEDASADDAMGGAGDDAVANALEPSDPLAGGSDPTRLPCP
jgi:hypothetical protein